MQISIRAAKTQLSRLVKLVEQGETVVIAHQGKPVAQLVPVRRRGLPFGIAVGNPIVPAGDAWWQPLAEKERDDWIEGR